MARLVVVLTNRRGSAVEPATISALCLGIADICRHQEIEVDGKRFQVRARVRRVRQGSIKFHFDVQSISSAATSFGSDLASGLAAAGILAAFQWLYRRSAHGRRARARDLVETLTSPELREALRSPEVVGAARELFNALHQDTAITGVKVEVGGESVKFDSAAIEDTQSLLADTEWGQLRDEEVLWGKHVRIVDFAGEGSTEEWRLHWDKPKGVVHEVWVKAVRVPVDELWNAGIDKTLVVDMRVKMRRENDQRVAESADILNVHWAQMR